MPSCIILHIFLAKVKVEREKEKRLKLIEDLL